MRVAPAAIMIFLLFLAIVPLEADDPMQCFIIPSEEDFSFCGINYTVRLYPTFKSYSYGLLMIQCDERLTKNDNQIDYAGLVCCKDDSCEHFYDLFPYHHIMLCYQKTSCYYFRGKNEGKPFNCDLGCNFWRRIHPSGKKMS
ncbi:hypothetical protein XELAEV_18045774mg [Xenopus laevis]|uniref:Uncharacterized protein n=1 Tax=Xenopus laevis TaxID=8355 RepID=A0A974C1J3_XENLA|nr:hypothetical protein XELAEV_18045774mg [Xenopus laevis]